MAGRGRAPTPLRVLQARGSHRASSRADSVALPAAVPAAPPGLSAPARAAWDRIVPQLAAAGVLSLADAHALEQFCTTWAHWQAAVADVEAHGVTVERAGASGIWREVNPSVRLAAKLSAELRQLGDRLGLSPAARARLHTPPTEAEGWADEVPPAARGRCAPRPPTDSNPAPGTSPGTTS